MKLIKTTKIKDKLILRRIAENRFFHNLERKREKQRKRTKTHNSFLVLKNNLGDNYSLKNLFKKWLPKNISYILSCEKSPFHSEKLEKIKNDNNGIFRVPDHFSLIDEPDKSFSFIQSILASFYNQEFETINLDYEDCKKIELGTQVFLDILLKEFDAFLSKCNKYSKTAQKIKRYGAININNIDVKKLIFSVGSPAILINQSMQFADIVPYNLCIFDGVKSSAKRSEQKEVDTTTLIEYVLESLERVNKRLTSDKIDDLATVIGEILINAEEHASTHCRYSIGYFHEVNNDENHYGIFRLAILNFGKTIYEKFSDPLCPNKSVVQKMKTLSDSYNKKRYFFQKRFEEETLWTLYGLQEGVTSVDTAKYKRRGNGSIRFIESFFNMKGDYEHINSSRMSILSGNTNIIFNGAYKIKEKEVNGNKFKFMTFNESGDIRDKPDNKYVKFVDNYFPGTMICAEIIFNERDFENDSPRYN